MGSGFSPSSESPLRLTTPEQWLGTPTCGCSSRRTTFVLFLDASNAAWHPATPAPTMTTWLSWVGWSKDLSVVFELYSQRKTFEFSGEFLHHLKVHQRDSTTSPPKLRSRTLFPSRSPRDLACLAPD